MVDSNDSDPSNLSEDKILRGLPEVDGYKVLEPVVIYARIGEGGMGAVYRGRHLGLDIDVAIKCLKTNLAEESHEFVLRFKREAKVAATINSPHLIRVFDVNESNGIHYLIMEFVRGESARERVQRKGALALEEAVTIVRSAAKGLAAAHAKGAVHRDIKPDNIMISTEGEVKVADLGLAKAADGLDNLETRSGMVMGTPTYMPPEQYGDVSKVGPSGDVYSLAVTLYYLLAGKHAIQRGTLVEVMYQVCQGDFPDIGDLRPTLPPALSDVIAKATAKDPLQRYQKATEFARALAPFVSDELDDEVSDHVLKEKGLTGQFNRQEMLVSPPPQDTIARIKMKLNEPQFEEPTVRSANKPSHDHFRDDSSATTISPHRTAITPIPIKKSRVPAILFTAVIVLALAAIGGYWWMNKNGSPPTAKDEQANAAIKKDTNTNNDAAKAETPKKSEIVTPVKKNEKAASKPKLVDYIKMFEQAHIDVKRYATLESGIEKYRRIKKDATDVIGIDQALANALLTLGEKKQNDGQLGAAMLVVNEARELDPSERAVALDKDLSQSIDAVLQKSLSIDSPSKSQIFSELVISLQGRIDEISLNLAGLDGYTVSIGGKQIPVTTGLFSYQVTLKEEGAHSLDIALESPVGRTVTRSVAVIIDQSDPVLALDIEANGAIPTKEGVLILTGTVIDTTTCQVDVTARHQTGTEEKKSTTVSPGSNSWAIEFNVSDGKTDFEIVAKDAAGRTTTISHSTNVDDSAPVLTLNMAKASGQVVDLRNIKIQGTISDKSPCRISIKATTPTGQQDEKFITVTAGENPWDVTFPLSEGRTSFVITAKDETDREDRKTYDVIVDRTAPTLSVDALPQETEAFNIVIRGRASDLNGAIVDINGTQVNTDLNGSFSQQQNLRLGTNTFRVRARDNLNHSILKTLIISRRTAKPVQVVSQIQAQHDVNLKPIKAGSFMMGSPSSEPNRGKDEVRHRVVLSRDFYMSQTEVTRGQWDEVMRTKPWDKFRVKSGLSVGLGLGFGGRAKIRPPTQRHSNKMAVGYVTYNDALNFCDRLNREYQFPGWEFRLPTESEWEYCCRAGRPTAFSFGDGPKDQLKRYAYFKDNGKTSKTPFDVNTKSNNQWGLSDMHGNVREWCLDWYGPYNARGANDPRGPTNGSERITRGGSLKHKFGDCRSANRIANSPDNREFSLGFRIVLAPK
ncbi:MAG: serine/threonine protein kinase/formylglycine-generating enzyme required for sulfatase activity [Planctomycetota bacterium]|jgi:serine/threonine protein kinase/formylglycine-generating enzyme required for sulfatase activity